MQTDFDDVSTMCLGDWAARPNWVIVQSKLIEKSPVGSAEIAIGQDGFTEVWLYFAVHGTGKKKGFCLSRVAW